MAGVLSVKDRLNTLTALVEQIVLHTHNTGGTPTVHTPQNVEPRGVDDITMRVDVQDFEWTSNNPKDYIDLEDSLERYFYFDTPEEHKYKIAKVKLTKLAPTWLEGVQKQKRREKRTRISTWPKLNKHLKRKYVPSTY